ncbi:MAG TPA: hypothetical protein VK731_08170 [Candidatus Cybelea sp.]|nr:hypothetical protein [Candidatus Cybelea sp.]
MSCYVKEPSTRTVLSPRLALLFAACFSVAISSQPVLAQENLLTNPSFEASAGVDGTPPNWERLGENASQIKVTDKEAHDGRQCLAIPAGCAIEQRIENAPAGAYVLRCWVKSEADQLITLCLQDPDRPWEAFSCAERQAPKGQWTQLQAFCVLDRPGALTVMMGGMSDQFRLYHGVAGKMSSPIMLDTCELIRSEPASSAPVEVWDVGKEWTNMTSDFQQWSLKSTLPAVHGGSNSFPVSPVFVARHLVGMVRSIDGGLVVCAVEGQGVRPRTVLVPSPTLPHPKCRVIYSGDRTGLQVASKDGEQSYTAWLTSKGLITIEASHIPKFEAQGCNLSFGILPSLVGSDICYDPRKLPEGKQIDLPSTQWFVGLADGGGSMMVAAWDTEAQAVALGLSGAGEDRKIDSLSIATDKAGFSISFVEHAGIWHKEPLKEDWLGDYVPVAWTPPFPARWMGEFFCTTGKKPYFDDPYNQYSFPVANAKTRMWGVWFEGWNHYPFYFQGEKLIAHFEKGFVPKGDALFYFLEPAAADLYSPVEILEQALGREKAAAILDLDANGLRKLSYSTPAEFMYDRPVCATTTHLSHIPREEKGTVGINLATHLYEFIREIRVRIDDYVSFFDRMQGYLEGEDKAHPELHPYISELQGMVSEAKSKATEIYATPLPAVKTKTEAMKSQLLAGKGDGFDCGNLDVRDTAGDQDDLCRHYNRLVLHLCQTATLECGDSPEKALIALHVWNESRKILHHPVRWEARRTLYFSEP